MFMLKYFLIKKKINTATKRKEEGERLLVRSKNDH